MTWITWTGHAVSENDRIKAAKKGKRYYLSPEYRAFKGHLFWHFVHAKQQQGWTTKQGPMAVEIRFHVPARMDDHNLLKPILDALQLAGWVENDRQFRDRRLIRMEDAKDGQASIEIGIKEI